MHMGNIWGFWLLAGLGAMPEWEWKHVWGLVLVLFMVIALVRREWALLILGLVLCMLFLSP